jgi:hypothetical protein
MAETATRRVKPAPDRRVRWPDGRLLAADGEAVPANDPYWIRRLHDEDVVDAPPARAAAPKKED